MKKKYAIHWFRRDLRVAANNNLKWAWKKHDGRVLGLFCFDKAFLSRPDFSVNRFQFFIESLVSLKSELQALGGDLLVLDVGPSEAFSQLFDLLQSSSSGLPETVVWGRDYEPFACERDARMKKWLSEKGVEFYSERDHLLIEPEEVHKDSGPADGYQVYSPFARKWLQRFDEPEVQKRVAAVKSGFRYLEELEEGQSRSLFSLRWQDIEVKSSLKAMDVLEEYRSQNAKSVTVDIPPAGSLAAYQALKNFAERLDDYKDKRDFPSVQGTSRFSMYLKNGSLTVPQIIQFFDLQSYKKKQSGRDTFLSELIWREFYYHILARHPYVEKGAFLKYYNDIEWQNNAEWFEAWKEGKTGFPIVDAAMRELKTTGWMHNRARMIVASFLTKDLLIDWRWGEQYFMETLLDGDLAPNNGGWQWAASTGCDPQPYFRIFNPWLQGQKFDPQGDYIKKFVPELRDVSVKQLHSPQKHIPGYPQPIVDHSVQRNEALEMYKRVRDSQ